MNRSLIQRFIPRTNRASLITSSSPTSSRNSRFFSSSSPISDNRRFLPHKSENCTSPPRIRFRTKPLPPPYDPSHPIGAGAQPYIPFAPADEFFYVLRKCDIKTSAHFRRRVHERYDGPTTPPKKITKEVLLGLEKAIKETPPYSLADPNMEGREEALERCVDDIMNKIEAKMDVDVDDGGLLEDVIKLMVDRDFTTGEHALIEWCKKERKA